MHVPDFLLQLMLILLSARILGELAGRLHIPPVIGEMLAGVIVGPSLLGLMSPSDTIRLLADIGIILLLFDVGLNTDLARLAHSGWKAFWVASIGVCIPFALGFAVARWVMGMAMVPSLFTGGTLTATSVGITVRVLADLGRLHSREAQIVIGAAVLDDIMGVLVLAALCEYAGGNGVSFLTSVRISALIGLFMLLAPIATVLLSRAIRRFDESSSIPGFLPTSMVVMVLLAAWLAQAVGAPQLLGGFAAGLALSSSFRLPFAPRLRNDPAFCRRIDEQMQSIVHLFVPIFFVMVGLTLNLREVEWNSARVWLLSGLLLIVAVAGKVASGLFMRSETPAGRWAIGISMVARGEVGLIFAQLGRSSGIFDQTTYAALLIVIAMTTLVPPFVLRWFYGKGPGVTLPA